MSLNATPELVARARDGLMTTEDFLGTIRESLPEAWKIVEFHASEIAMGRQVSVHAPRSMDDVARGQLLRLVASSSMRAAVQEHYGYVLEFQNCHKTAAFVREIVGGPEWLSFVSPEAQIMNQSPELRDC